MMLSKAKFVIMSDHITAHSSEISRLTESQLDGRCTELDCRVDPDVRRCRYCNTDFQVEIKEIGEKDLALVITKWLDLGSGSTPMGTRWRAHLAEPKRQK
jgi:hypothetical protein